MEIGTVLLIVVILILLFYLIRYVIADTNTMTGIISGTDMTTIVADDLASSASGTSTSNFTYSIWYYLEDWNYKYGEPKVIFGRMSSLTDGDTSSVPGINGIDPCPVVFLGPISNNLEIALNIYPGITNESDISDTPSASQIHTCSIPNVPIQKWVNVLISAYGRTLDVYIDGKLVKTSVMAGVAKIDDESNVYVTPNGGLSGWTAKFQYWPNSSNPQEAWNTYERGYGASWLSFLGKYQVKVSLVENGQEESSLTL